MAWTVWEATGEDAQASMSDPSLTQRWMAQSDSDPATPTAARAALIATLPSTYNGLYLQGYSQRELGGRLFEFRVTYGRRLPLQEDVAHLTADSTGQTIHRETSLETIARYTEAGAGATSPADAVDYDQLIGVNDGRVEGVDVITPGGSFSVTKRFNMTGLAAGFCQTLMDLTGTVNNLEFTFLWRGQLFSFAAGDLRYDGCSIQEAGLNDDGQNLMDVTYRFTHSPAVADLEIGPITGIDKEGWQYLWVTYEQAEDTAGDRIVKRPKQVNIEKVYEYGAFSLLGLGFEFGLPP